MRVPGTAAAASPQDRTALLFVTDPPPAVPLALAAKEALGGAGGRVGLVADAAGEAGPVAAVAEPGDGEAEGGAGADVVYVVAVVLAAADGDHGGAQQGQQADEPAGEVAAVAEDAQLAGEEQGQVAEPGEGEARVPRREGAPAVVQHVVVRLGAHVDSDEHGHGHEHAARRRGGRAAGGGGSRGGGLAPRQKVGPRPAHRVLNHIGQEGGQHEADGEAEDSVVVSVGAAAALPLAGGEGGRRREDRVVEEQHPQWHEQGVDEVQPHGHALNLGVREGDPHIAQGKHPVEGLDE